MDVGTNVGKPVGRRQLHKLADRGIRSKLSPGYYGDGGGLWLQVSASDTRSWVFRYTLNGRSREMGLGSLQTVSLARAREVAAEQRLLLQEKIDPIERRDETRRQLAQAAARAVAFKAEAEAFIEAKRPEWKNDKHAAQWKATLEQYAYPVMGRTPVDEIDTDLVLRCLRPIWTTKTETASRVRGRIESVLDYATALKHRSGDNPARWRGHLENLLAAPQRVAKVEHHAALPYVRIGECMEQLRAADGTAARAVEFIILTAARTSEAIHAEWSEIDLEAAQWIVPAERMKAKREHRVPLSRPAVALLRRMQLGSSSPYVFPGAREGKPLSNMAGLMLLERMGFGEYTVHGFRSTFRDWAAEQTSYPREVAEMALAHTIKSATEAAYRRGDLYEKRAKLMQAWADYCARAQTPGSVTAIGAKRAVR